MKKITQEKLKEKLRLHKMWLNGEDGGERLVLIGYDLRDSDLSDSDLRGSDLRYSNLSYSDLRGSNLRGSNLRGSDLRGSDLDFSCLPLWCGGQFKADDRICKQLVAHVVRIMYLSEIDQPELIEAMNAYKSGWHREDGF